MKAITVSLIATCAISLVSTFPCHGASSSLGSQTKRTIAAAEAARQIQPFSPLTGSFAAGTTQFTWVDESRREIYSSDSAAKRTVVVQVWYPVGKEKSRSHSSAPYLLSPREFLGDTEDAKKLRTYNSRIRTRSLLNAPMANSHKVFPVLIFNPGGGNPRFTSSFAAEQLASHGFIVFAVEHYGDSMATHYPNGSILGFDRQPRWVNTRFLDRLAKGLASSDEIINQTLFDWKKRETEFWPVEVSDNQFVIKKIEELNRAGSENENFAGRMDLKKIGAFGWSMGGGHAIHLLVHDPRVKVAVDYDGQFFGKQKASLKTNKPVMLLYGVNDPESDPQMKIASETLGNLVKSWSNFLMTHSTGPRYDLTIAGAHHGTFSDWHLFNAQISRDPEVIEFAQRRERLITHLTVSFFKKYLMGTRNVEVPALHPLICRRRAHAVAIDHQSEGELDRCQDSTGNGRE